MVDHCYNQPCFKRGACVNSVDGYQCNCHEGFQGLNCQGMCPLYLKKKTTTKKQNKNKKRNKTQNTKKKKKQKRKKTKQQQQTQDKTRND